MAQASPPPYSPWPPASNPYRLVGPIIAVVVIVVFVVFFLILNAFIGGMGFGFPGFDFVFAPFCGMFIVFIIVFALIAMGAGTSQRRIPPPPPIQQPMVPAGTPGTVELMCPNCGAAPRNVDRFGIATCDYCNTRFMVR